ENFSNSNGTIVTLSSSNPDVLLLSRAATTAGTASVVVAVPAGGHLTQTIYLQGLAQGSAVIQASVNGSAQGVATVAITNSWVSCGPQPVSLNAGTTKTLSCSIVSNLLPSALLQEVGPRAGVTDLILNLSSSAPDIFTVTPASATLGAGGTPITLRGIAPGTGILRLTPPAVFGPSPDASEAVMVTVTQPPLTAGCATEIVLGMNTQYTCSGFAASGTVTATSSDPALLLVSADAKTAGGPAASIAGNGQSVSLTFQALAGYGTVEVVVSAPGYIDLRLAIALRPSEIALVTQSFQSPPLALRVGNSASFTIAMRVGGAVSTPRVGANVAVDLATDQAGIVS